MLRQLLFLTLAFALLCGAAAPAVAQVKWENERPPTKEEFDTIQEIMKTLVAAMANKPGKLCPVVGKDGKYKTDKGNKLNVTENGKKKKMQLCFPKTKNDKSKHRIAPRPEPGPAPSGTPPGPEAGPSIGTEGGSVGVNPAKATWQDLVKCLADMKGLIIADNNSTTEPEKSRAAEARSGGVVVISSEQMKKAMEDPEQFVYLISLLMHEIIHTKQSIGAGDDPEPPAYTGQKYILCWIEDWLEKIANEGGDGQPQDAKDAVTNLATRMGITTDGKTLEEIANEILEDEGLAETIQHWKRTLTPPTTGGKGNGPAGWINFPWNDDGFIEVDNPDFPGGLWLLPSGGLPEVLVGLPLETMLWAVPWTADDTGEATHLLIAGQVAGEWQLLIYQDFDGDLLPESLVETLSPGNLDAHAVRMLAGPGETPSVLLLQADDGVVARLVDGDGDGLPESFAPVPFAADPLLATMERFTTSRLDAEGRTVVLDAGPPAPGTGPFLLDLVALTDADLDGVAETLDAGDYRTLVSGPTPPPLLAEADFRGADLPNPLQPGSLELITLSEIPGDVLEVRDLTAGGLPLGTVGHAPPQAWGLLPLGTPLAALDFLEVTSLVDGQVTVQVVPPFDIIYGHSTVGLFWDAGGDGIDDAIAMSQKPGRLWIGHRAPDGTVTSVERLVLPDSVAVSPEPGVDGDLGFTGNLEGWDPEAGSNRFERVGDAPGFTLAQNLGDLDGDGITGDRFAMVVGEAGQAMGWASLDGGPWQSVITIPDGWMPILSYLPYDEDGDGDLDLELCPNEPGIEVPCELYLWQDGAYMPGSAPVEMGPEPPVDGEPTMLTRPGHGLGRPAEGPANR